MINPASLLGAIFGFLFGIFFFGSPLLAIVFSIIGSSLGARIGLRIFRDSSRSSGGNDWFAGWGIGGSTEGPIFMETLFSMLGSLAAADGRVSEEEKQIFRNVVVNELRIHNPQSIQAAMQNFNTAAASSQPISVYARRAAQTFGNRPQLKEMMLIIMIRVCAASEGIHPEEDRLLREVAGIFGYSSAAFESIRSRYTFGGYSSSGKQNHHATDSTLHEAYEILGISEDATESVIRRAYRKKAAEYHPDKIAAKGLPEEFTEFANSKFQEIQKAWEKIRGAKGF